MKQLAILFAIIILSIIGYNQFVNYKRFNPPANYQLKANSSIDVNYYDRPFLNEYYRKIAEVNTFVLKEWTDKHIDVRSPKKSNNASNAAVAQYQQMLADVQFYEAILLQSATLKTKGYSNADIQEWQQSGVDPSKLKEFKKNNEVRETIMNTLKSKTWTVGDKGAGVWELQKLLIAKGYEMPKDGIFSTITQSAIMDFEEKNDLFPDGVVDEYSLNLLLRP